jgi:homoserine O-acetyltransferase
VQALHACCTTSEDNWRKRDSDPSHKYLAAKLEPVTMEMLQAWMTEAQLLRPKLCAMKHISLLFVTLLLLTALCFPQEGQQQFASMGNFKLESGETILDCRIGYRTFGRLNADRSNIVVMSTWFTGRTGEMMGLFGEGKLIDTSKYYVIAIDSLGNGVSSSPSNSKLQPRMKFPKFSIVDVVNSEYKLLTNVLAIHHVRAVTGSSSIGGQATLQWMVSYPDFMDKAIPISASPRLTAYDLLFRQALRDAITSDPNWNNGNYTVQPGARLVGELASLVDITPEVYNESHKREDVPAAITDMANAIAQFDANDLLRQSEAMSTHDISRQFGGSMEEAGKVVKAKTLIIVTASERIVNPGPALKFAKLIRAEALELHN